MNQPSAAAGVSVDTTTLDLSGASGAVWSLPHGGDLDANVVVLHPGHTVDAHVNHDVDVLIIGLRGRGTVTVDHATFSVADGVVLQVTKGRTRAISATGDGPLVYVTVHRARAGLGIQPRRR